MIDQNVSDTAVIITITHKIYNILNNFIVFGNKEQYFFVRKQKDDIIHLVNSKTGMSCDFRHSWIAYLFGYTYISINMTARKYEDDNQHIYDVVIEIYK